MKLPSLHALRWLPYRVVRRLAIANVRYVYQLPIDKLPRTPTPAGYTIQSCSSDRLRAHANELDYQIAESDLEMVDTGEAKCFAAFRADSLAGFAWVGFGAISGDMNRDSKPETGLPIQLVDDAAFIFQVLVLPGYRGQRLYAAIMSRMAEELQSEGIQTLVLTTEGSNHRALRAVHRMAFQKVAQTSLLQMGPIRRATYAKRSPAWSFSIGRYVGDASLVENPSGSQSLSNQ